MLKFPNNKVYIGSTNNLERRLQSHKYPHKIQAEYPVSIAIKECGFHNIEKIVIEEFETYGAFVTQREEYWTKYYNSDGNGGYNEKCGNRHSESIKSKLSVTTQKWWDTASEQMKTEHSEKLKKSLKAYWDNLSPEDKEKRITTLKENSKRFMKKVLATDKEGNVYEFESTYEAAKELSKRIGKTVYRSHVSNCAHGRKHYNSHRGFTFKFKEK